MNPFALLQSLHTQKNDAEYRFAKLKLDMFKMERHLDKLEDEIEHLLSEIEHNLGNLAGQFESRSA